MTEPCCQHFDETGVTHAHGCHNYKATRDAYVRKLAEDTAKKHGFKPRPYPCRYDRAVAALIEVSNLLIGKE